MALCFGHYFVKIIKSFDARSKSPRSSAESTGDPLPSPASPGFFHLLEPESQLALDLVGVRPHVLLDVGQDGVDEFAEFARGGALVLRPNDVVVGELSPRLRIRLSALK